MERTDAIIILGHRLLPGNLPSDDLKRRIDRAVALWRETNAPIVMPCGGITHERQRTEAEVIEGLNDFLVLAETAAFDREMLLQMFNF